MAKIWRECQLVTAAKANTDVDAIWEHVEHMLVTESWHTLNAAAIATEDVRYQQRLRALSDRVFDLWQAAEQRRKTDYAAAQCTNPDNDRNLRGTLGKDGESIAMQDLREAVFGVAPETTNNPE